MQRNKALHKLRKKYKKTKKRNINRKISKVNYLKNLLQKLWINQISIVRWRLWTDYLIIICHFYSHFLNRLYGVRLKATFNYLGQNQGWILKQTEYVNELTN